ncbi:erythromycin esterase family protein [Streptomyces capparidis]
MAERVFRDRREAGRLLAGHLDRYRRRPDVLVLGLPRGGVPVAFEVASALGAPLDVFLVRKLGVPRHEELAMGALASGGVVVLNEDVVQGLGIPPGTVERVAEQEGRELLRREHVYREGRPLPAVEGRTVLLVDDGLATGASMRAAVQALARLGPARIVVAVPTAPESAADDLEGQADEVVCAMTPSPFVAVGGSYWDFTQTTDAEVRELLRAAARARPVPTAPDPPSSAAAPAPPRRTGRAPGPDPRAVVHAEALPARGGVPSDEALFALVGDARFVLIGEASHGTEEFYAARAHMTRRLIEEKGFTAVAVEGDWPDAYRVNRHVRGGGGDAGPEEALRGFTRFPAWMWRNTVVLDFVRWLREHNERIAAPAERTGFYGLDLYSLHRSVAEVVAYLDRVDPRAAARARARYACLDHYGADEDPHGYGRSAAFGAGDACEREMIEQLVELRRGAHAHARRDGLLAEDERFDAEQNARTVQDAAEYYRAMFSLEESTWNLRDRHMADTLLSLSTHLGRLRGDELSAKVVVWAHNSHLGDARATEPAARGELNLGQIVRERHGGDCRLIGFSTYSGTVTAADNWDAPADRKRVRPALDDSVEKLLHEVGRGDFWLPFPFAPRSAAALRPSRLERAIGVVYRPRTERLSHYFHARVSDQFDALVHVDHTRALQPLERSAGWERGELPETYPSAV